MGGKHATTTSAVSVPKAVLDRYNAINTRAETAASQPFRAFGNTASDYVAQMNAQQNAGIADINATAGSYQPYMTQATSATQAGMGPAYEGIENYMSPYTKNVADTTGAMMRQQQEQAQSGALGTAAMSGAFGGDRAGIAAANLQQQNQMGYGKTMADIMNQGYTQALGASQADLARQLQGGAQMAALGAQSQQLGLQGAQAKLAAGTLQQQTEQAGKDAMINRFMQEQGLPYQQAQFLANIAMGTGALSGSTTTTQTPRNWMGFEAGGRVEGYADGGGVIGPMEYSKAGIGGQSYVPEANLPVGQLMIAEPPQDQGGGGQQVMQMLQTAMGAARGGVIGEHHGYASGGVAGDRHGYQTDGAVQGASTSPELVRQFFNALPGAFASMSGYSGAGGAGLAAADAAAKASREKMAAEGTGDKYNDPILRTLNGKSQETTKQVDDLLQDPFGLSSKPQGVNAPAPAALTAAPQGGVVPAPVAATQPQPRLNFGSALPSSTPPAGFAPQANMAAPLSSGLVPAQNVTPSPIQPNAGLAPAHQPNKRDADLAEVARRESGNDADALYGFANREGGPFAGTKVTNMTVDQAIDFSKPGGAYANYSLDKLGRIATPMGKYQIVGRTLQQAKDDLGLTGNEIMTEDLQKRIAEHLYDTSGLSPWASSMGGGSSGVGGGGGGGGDNTGLAAGVKPYEERTAIGKFFHNPEGGTNTNAVLSLLAGIGRAAEAPTISPIGAILSGIGAGADAYNTLRKEEPDRVAKVMANSQAARMNYMQAVEMGETRPFDQWAKAQYGTGVGSMIGDIAPGSNAAATVMSGGNPSFDISGKGLSAQIELPNGGGMVSVSQNYKALSDYENAVQPMAALGNATAINTLTRIKALKDAIVAQNGTVYDVNGNPIQDPTYTGMVNAGELTAQGRAATLEFNKQKADRSYVLDQNINEIDNQANIFSELNAGALANEKARALAIGIALGVPVPEGSSDYVSAVQESVKNAGRKTLQRLESTAPAAEMERLGNIIEDPSMQPEAIKMILSLQKAEASRELARYTLRDQWNAANPQLAMDQMAYDKWFAESEPFSKYYESAKKNMPFFAGELGSMQKPYQLSKDPAGNYAQADAGWASLPAGASYYDPNGVLKKKPKE
jgi:hypothetical protein